MDVDSDVEFENENELNDDTNDGFEELNFESEESNNDCSGDDDDDEPCAATANFEDFTFKSNTDTPTKVETKELLPGFLNNDILSKAKPGTWLYNKIVTSTPMLASNILTMYLNVKSVHCVYMEPDDVEKSSFYTKKK